MVAAIALLLALTFALSASDARASGPLSPYQTWAEQDPANHPAAQISNTMAFDPSTGEVVMFGGTSASYSAGLTWVWDGIDWTRKFPETSPLPRLGASMAYDQKSGNVLMFGGTNAGSYYNETWSWDGTDWTQLNPATRPPFRSSAGMAFDEANGEIVLYGGFGSEDGFSEAVPLDDTWTWNGADWSQESPADNPPAGSGSRMAFDPAIGRVLAYGFFGDEDRLETWTWSGSNWTRLTTPTSPAVGSGAVMDYNPAIGKTVLFGGDGFGNDTWTFDGTDWERFETPESPPARTSPAMSFDPATGRMLLFGGYGPGGVNFSDTWLLGPPPGVESDWTAEDPDTALPARYRAAMAFDPSTGSTVLFGGADADGNDMSDTWTWDGSDWAQQSPPNSPVARNGAAAAFDPQSGNVLMFGGSQDGFYSSGSWVWTGGTWSAVSLGSSPYARTGAAMAYDQASGEMVLFGGNSTSEFGDTWVFNGTTWSQKFPATSPPARTAASMAFDQSTGKIVLFGGMAGGQPMNDTWTWDGTNWTQETPANSPRPLLGGSMSFYPVTGDVVLFGGLTVSGRDSGTWVWDGTDWHQQYPRDTPPLRYVASMDFDPTQGELVLFGGLTDAGVDGDTWTYALKVAPPTATITDPVQDQQVPVGSDLATSFSCEESPGGPGLSGCEDQDGAPAPAGQLDTSSVGFHVYSVTATSENGQVGFAEVGYEVTRAEPSVSVGSVADAEVGEPVIATGTLSGGYDPGGEITFRVFGPDDPQCSGAPVFESTAVAVTGNDQYASTPGFVPAAGGLYRWVAEYSGDANNQGAKNACGAAGSVLEVARVRPSLTANSATDAELGNPITVAAELTGGIDPTGQVVFRAYGPDASACSGEPAYASPPQPVTGAGRLEAPGFSPGYSGSYRWTATYSGDDANEGVTTACGADGTISTLTAVPPPVVCPERRPGLRLAAFGLEPPFGHSRQVPGIRVRMFSRNSIVRIDPTMVYRAGGRTVRATMRTRTLTIGQRRSLRFHVPRRVAKAVRRSGRSLKGTRVTFVVRARIRPRGSAAKCFREIRTRKLNTRVTGVSGRVALRRLP